MPYKHRRHFILTNFTLPRLRTPGTPAFLQAICLEPYIRNFVRPPLGHSSHMAAPPALSHTTHTSMNLSSPFSVRVCFARLSRAYNPSHCIWLTLLGVSVNPLPGVTPSFEISVMQFSKAIHGFQAAVLSVISTVLDAERVTPLANSSSIKVTWIGNLPS